ncbi:Sau3AI family type II restriction endonuclease [Bifidobacterium sp. ESL0704]|uniref:Sau3AI family type II restriction endonuclease n=1 Tax=Bifidobacterium sp. ESL0704 TaxID=2983219 RepID=UPI0023FA06CA|nr:Sau3AI family type II restriction endonuclease [Bifidobacterium sp. ESL0704]WEV53335.1 Sau3AI family type II restriction endonuclease [Bifidobacterium sp. ESL0704]
MSVVTYDDVRQSDSVDHAFASIDQVLSLLNNVQGRSFRQIDITGRGAASGNKGSLGQIVEESVLGYAINSDPNPDIVAGGKSYELKVTPLRHSKRRDERVVAKERLVLDIINYMRLPEETFGTSRFWNKSRRIVIIYYFDDRTDKKNQSRLDCKLYCSVLLDYEAKDFLTIKADWQTIHDKVTEGHADTLSEADTNYLAACTKGASAATVRDAPAPDGACDPTIKAKQRAFSYKASYMSTVAEKILDKGAMPTLPMSAEQTLEQYIGESFDHYVAHPVSSIAEELAMPQDASKAKQFTSMLTLRMLGSGGHSIEQVEQFRKAHVNQVKTATLYEQGRPKEHMSFRQISQEEWNQLADPSVEFHDSFLYRFFEENRFLFSVFQASGAKRQDSSRLTDVFEGGFLWNMPEADIERYVYPAWAVVHRLLVNGESIHYGRGTNLLPGASFNHVFHFRSKARNGKDQVTLPNGESITKQTFWLDRDYVAKIIELKL